MRRGSLGVAAVWLALAAACAAVSPAPPSPPEDAQARWLREDVVSCEHGEAAACERVGDRFADFETGQQDGGRATTFYERGCERRLRTSCVKLARLLAGGALVPADAPRARVLFGAACDEGDVDSCYELAVLLVNGDGGARDPAAAVPLLEKACARDQSRACDVLDHLDRERLVRPDLGRFGASAAPPGLTLATGSGHLARSLRRHFPVRLTTPFPYAASELPVVAADLCRFANVRVVIEESALVVTGRMSVAALPPTLSIGSRSANPGAYRRWLMGLVVGRDGALLWSAEAASVGHEWSGPEGLRGAPFTIRGAAPSGAAKGATLVLVLSGDPIVVSPLDRGGLVVLGHFTERL